MRPKPRTFKKKDLVRRIRLEFSKLSFARARQIESGDDHAVLILDERLVFRFPRTAAYRKSFREEVKLLEALKYKTSMRIPGYTYLARDGSFGGYRLIAGDNMTVGRFSRLAVAQKKRAIAALARFLTALHRVNKKRLSSHRAQEPWSGGVLSQYRRRYWNERRGVLASRVDRAVLNELDHFYDAFLDACARVPSACVVHGDLSDHHILLNVPRGSIAGIIDFGDAAIADPALDFCFFWAYGDWVVPALYRQYGGRRDRGLIGRSRWHYCRYMIDRLFYAVREHDRREQASVLAALRRELAWSKARGMACGLQ